VVILAPPAGSTLIEPVLTSGRWLTGEDENAVVVGNHYIKLHPETKVGDRITIRIEEKDYPFTIVGIYKMAGTVFQPILYMNFEYLASTMNESGQAYSIRVVTDAHDAARQKEVSKAIETRFKQLGYPISSIITGQEIVIQQRITVDVLIYLLLGMAILIAVVGGLGLMGTMGMNVLERTREIGVMRSIGAVDSAIMQLVLVEGMVIGLISWALGAVLSIPIAQGLNNVIGTSLLNVPLDYTFSLSGLIMWAVIVAILSTVACIIPARNAVRLTVRDVLAYE
jgi:putative ABC transport system permease protein